LNKENNMKSLGDFAMLEVRNVFRKNPLGVKALISNRVSRRLMKKIDQKRALKEMSTQGEHHGKSF